MSTAPDDLEAALDQHFPDAFTTERPTPKDRYRAEIRHRRGWLWEVDLVTTHDLHVRGERGERVKPLFPESRLLVPYLVVSEWWARCKGRRLIAAAKRQDVREQQPWAVVR